MPMPLMESGDGPWFVNVRIRGALSVPTAWLTNVKFTGPSVTAPEADRVAVGGTAFAIPVPVSVAVCGLLPALSVTISVPVGVPATVGLKVMLIVQNALTGSEGGQSLL